MGLEIREGHVDDMLDNQLVALADTVSDILVYQGGYRSGKTVLEAAKAWDLGLANYPADGLFVAPSFPMVRGVFIKEARKMFAKWGVASRWYERDKILTIGSRRPITLHCRSADAPRSIEGLTVGWVIIDEWELCAIEAIIVAEARKSLKCPVPQSVFGGTPEQFGPAWQTFLRDPQPGTRVIVSKTIDNRHIRKKYVDDLARKLSNEGINEKLLGERTMPSSRIYTRFDRRLHCEKPCVVDARHGHLEMWCDFNVDPMAWGFFQVDREHKLFHCVGELVVKATDSERQAAEATAWVRAWKSKNGLHDTSHRGMWAICDANANERTGVVPISHTMNLHRAGFAPIHPNRNPFVDDRISAVQRALGGPNPLGGSWPVHLTFDEKAAPYVVSCIAGQQRGTDGRPDKEGGLDHGSDLVGYGVMRHWPTEAPRPKGIRPTQRAA